MEIKYELIRSNRKTLCISIRDNKVIVRAPMRTPLNKIEDFVSRKRDWISKHLSKSSSFDGLTDYKSIFVRGTLVPLVFGETRAICENFVSVRKISDIKKLYIDNFGQEFLALFKEISLKSGLKASSVQFKSYKSRWGCCDTKKIIIFNYKLLMLPVDLWQCVIVHELCHTVFMDHSKNFKALACSVMPDYLTVHKKLKAYSVVTRLY